MNTVKSNEDCSCLPAESYAIKPESLYQTVIKRQLGYSYILNGVVMKLQEELTRDLLIDLPEAKGFCPNNKVTEELNTNSNVTLKDPNHYRNFINHNRKTM